MPSPPDTVSNAAAPEASADPPQWVSREDFLADYNSQIVSNYPDRVWARCQDGVPQRAVHWSPRPAGQRFDLRGVGGKKFEADAAAMTAKGFKVQYDNVFQNCDGTTQHQTLWMKEE